jgi:hypothetical protein
MSPLKYELLRDETSEQIRAKTQLRMLISVFMSASYDRRRSARHEIRELVMLFPWLGDLIPDAVYAQVYCVRSASGTKSPTAMNDNENSDSFAFDRTVLENKL